MILSKSTEKRLSTQLADLSDERLHEIIRTHTEDYHKILVEFCHALLKQRARSNHNV